MNRLLSRSVLLFVLVFIASGLSAQTFTGTGGPIPDDGTHGYYTLNVSGLSPATLDTNFGLESVCIDLTHTWDDDLVISLIAPDNTEFTLVGRCGGSGDNYTNTCFNTGAATLIFNCSPPFTGTFKPQGSMAAVNNGHNGNGVWTLHIVDTYPFADAGNLLSWSIAFGNNPATFFPFSGTRLPLVVINTHGKLIPDDPKIIVDLRIISNGNGQMNHMNDSANIYYGLAGMEQRGNSSGWMPKKSYNFETRNPDSTNRNVPLLGMPIESDWVLIANYCDKSLLRNYMTYYLFRQMGRWAPRMEICEVVLDGEYQGIYLLGEKIKRDDHRVNVTPMLPADTLGVAVTGGYIFKLDWIKGVDVTWSSNYPAVNNTNNLTYILDYPKKEYLQNRQLKYIKAVVDTFEFIMKLPAYTDTAHGYRKYLDEGSFIDYIILTEFVKNVDGYRLSMFFHKDRNGKINAGPPWDYDLAMGNADYMECFYPGGWTVKVQEDYTDQCPFWWQKFFQDTLFMNHLQCRWFELRQNVLDPSHVKNQIDSLATLMGTAVNVNFTKWPILGIYVWPNPSPLPQDYPGEIQKLKDWVDMRYAWLDSNWTGQCPDFSVPEMTADKKILYTIAPNPATDEFVINTDEPASGELLELRLSTPGGTLAWTGKTISGSKIKIPPGISSGFYLLNITGKTGSGTMKFVIIR